ncbi:MAG TPA: tetratricopeptide repeat protein [Candidatus Acidoferrum sp.]|nr:tetratricopeptide repeat protein [Candidatus Acidoferrum sp.]
MKISNIFGLFLASLSIATVMRASVPIIIATPGRMVTAMKRVTDAQDQLQKGDVAGAKRSVDAVLQLDPTFWPALYVRAQIYSHEGKYDLALKDCNEALRHDRSVVEAALLRANINARLGKHAEALKEYNYLISLHPRNVTLARVMSDRAWFRATCPNASFRNGQQAVKDAKAACSIMTWKDESMIDTLAAAYAETGDFNSAIQYVSQALAVKGISPNNTKLFQQHLAFFQQRKPIRL